MLLRSRQCSSAIHGSERAERGEALQLRHARRVCGACEAPGERDGAVVICVQAPAILRARLLRPTAGRWALGDATAAGHFSAVHLLSQQASFQCSSATSTITRFGINSSSTCCFLPNYSTALRRRCPLLSPLSPGALCPDAAFWQRPRRLEARGEEPRFRGSARGGGRGAPGAGAAASAHRRAAGAARAAGRAAGSGRRGAAWSAAACRSAAAPSGAASGCHPGTASGRLGWRSAGAGSGAHFAAHGKASCSGRGRRRGRGWRRCGAAAAGAAAGGGSARGAGSHAAFRKGVASAREGCAVTHPVHGHSTRPQLRGKGLPRTARAAVCSSPTAAFLPCRRLP